MQIRLHSIRTVRLDRRGARGALQGVLGLVRGLAAHDALLNSLLLRLPQRLLSLGRVLIEGLAGDFLSLTEMLGGEVTGLLRLLAEDVAGTLKV